MALMHYNFYLCRFFSPEAFILLFSFRVHTIIILLISQSEALPTFVLRSPISSFSLTDSQLRLC